MFNGITKGMNSNMNLCTYGTFAPQ